jgi:sirohydrochlorin ferrochelatase
VQTLPVDTAVVIVDHGSRRAEANAMLEEVCALYRRVTGTQIVEPAHMELAEPSIAQAVGRCAAQGAKRVVISLFFLSPGRHSRSDIPELACAAAGQYPEVEIVLGEPIGLDERLAEVLHARVEEAVRNAECGMRNAE